MAESFKILLFDEHGHTLLRFGDGQLSTAEAGIFDRHAVQVDVQPIGQLAHGDADAAGAEVIGLLDHAGRFRIAEQALQLALDRRIALLHF